MNSLNVVESLRYYFEEKKSQIQKNNTCCILLFSLSPRVGY